MSELGDLQRAFPPLVAKLIDFAVAQGFTLTFGEAWRSAACAAHDAAVGSGIAHSLHTIRLAIDLCLFKDGEYLTKTEDYAPLGAFWKTLHPAASWGGDFANRPDGNHFSLAYGGTR